nr:immunoglobulin heavy chain junction region [Macaca mulatta]MOX64821.1 immunoglobulin heavy chain junction region [Macaca mulatta]MOX65328.1 immunoglobulin heavy chain junction region [Macaca mulatta]
CTRDVRGTGFDYW